MVIIGHGINFMNIAQYLTYPNMPYMQKLVVKYIENDISSNEVYIQSN